MSISKLNEEYKKFLNKQFLNDKNFSSVVNDLCLLNVKYYNFDNIVKCGDIICNKEIARDLEFIFKELYENKYMIAQINLIDSFDFDDIKSMENNNTSCFNYRVILNTNRLSKHAYGLAIDINPLYNPYLVKEDGKDIILPNNGAKYFDRKVNFEHKIDQNDLCYKLFIKYGFIWGGDFEKPDYQHFEKI